MILDLTGHEVRIYGRKADGKEFYNEGVITDHKKGRCQFELTTQALAVAQDLSVEIVIYKDNTEILSTLPFTIHVVKSLMSDSSVESSNEYGALVVLYQNLYEAYALMTEMVEKIGTPEEKAQELNLNTMFEVWDYLISYLEENSTASVVSTVNSINSKIGTSGTTGSTTLFGLLGRGMVKSVQRGQFGDNALTKSEQIGAYTYYYKDITISSVNISKSIVLINTSFGNSTPVQASNAKLLNSTTLRIYNTYNYNPDRHYIQNANWQVIEFY